MDIPFIDLRTQYQQIKEELNRALNRTLDRGDFILGKEVRLFEEEFARYCRTKFAVGVNSGTDALFLGLLSLGVGKSDEVIVPAFTFIATALAVSFIGARVVFVDIDEDTYNINVEKIERAVTKRTKVILPVHLFGQPADMKSILNIAKKYNLKVIEDCAQSHGAEYKFKVQSSKLKVQKVGSLGDIGCFSFYPTKNLGAFGDGGMILMNKKEVYKKLLMLRDCGRKSKYEHKILGYNSRLDTIQAAVLRVKLKHLDKWNRLRRKKAKLYSELLKDTDVIIPKEKDYGTHIYHIYAIRVKNRNKVLGILKKKGINVLIHYPIPLHLQKVYKNLGYKRGDFPVAEKVSGEIISLSIHPHLEEEKIQYIVDTLKQALLKK